MALRPRLSGRASQARSSDSLPCVLAVYQVPVALLEGNIATALGENLEAIRDYVAAADGCGTVG